MGSKHASPPKRKKNGRQVEIRRLTQMVKAELYKAAASADVHQRTAAALFASCFDPIPRAKCNTILINAWWALGALTNAEGQGAYHDWDVLADSMNQARMLSAHGFGPEHAVQIEAALSGIFRAEQRAAELNRWGLDGDAQNDIAQALQVFEAQLANITQGDLGRALVDIDRLLRSGQVQQ